jgi:hypothetical protein
MENELMLAWQELLGRKYEDKHHCQPHNMKENWFKTLTYLKENRFRVFFLKK